MGNRRQGVYYTPLPIVRHMLRRAWAAWAGEGPPRVLDPACGAGIFLVAAYRRLLDDEAAQRGRPLTVEERLARLRASIFGVDIDLSAVEQTRRVLLREALGPEAPTHPDTDLAANVLCADALLDGAVLPACDILLANPPYVSFYARESRKPAPAVEAALTARYGDVVGGRRNLFLFFLALALYHRRPTGVAALIVPDTLGLNASYASMRRAVVMGGLRAVDWLDFTVFDEATVRPLVVVVGPGEGATVFRTFATTEGLTADQPLAEVVVSREDLARRAEQPWLRGGSGEQADLRDRVWQRAVPLDQLAEVRDGVNPGPAEGRARLINPPGPPQPTWRPVIEGRHVTPYRVLPTRDVIHYDPACLTPDLKQRGASLRRPAVFAPPKLVSRQTADTLVFALDEQGVVALNSVHCAHARDGRRDTLLYLLGLLNSRLLREVYRARFQETRAVFPQVHIAALRQLPVPWLWDAEGRLTEGAAALVALVTRRLAGELLDAEIDAVVDSLYATV
ncbi:MAG: N-6 DNA methylase [Anaerolineae bacterium]|nr:N-6 DNA methylase [Anaerolineae bacterium]